MESCSLLSTSRKCGSTLSDSLQKIVDSGSGGCIIPAVEGVAGHLISTSQGKHPKPNLDARPCQLKRRAAPRFRNL